MYRTKNRKKKSKTDLVQILVLPAFVWKLNEQRNKTDVKQLCTITFSVMILKLKWIKKILNHYLNFNCLALLFEHQKENTVLKGYLGWRKWTGEREIVDGI